MITKMLTILLMAVFYICYFAKMISQRKKGMQTDQLGKGKAGFVKFIEVALKVATYVIPFIQLFSIIYSKESICTLLKVAGVAITATGVTTFIISVVHMKDNWRAGVQRDDKTNLVVTGIYAISRNPAFLGFDLMYVGILLSYFNCYLCLATVITVLLFHLQIVKVEEVFLIEAFGDEYLQYKSKVCRYLGRKR